MATYTAQLVLSEPDYTSKTAMYSKGDIVAVYDRINESPNPNGKLCFLHVSNVPSDINLVRLGEELSRPEITTLTTQQEVSKKRAWFVNLAVLNCYQELLDNKEATIEWSDVVSLFIRKFDGKTGAQYYTELNL